MASHPESTSPSDNSITNPQPHCILHEFREFDFSSPTLGRTVTTSTFLIEELLRDEFELPPVADAKVNLFRWLHVPVNNMAWVKVSCALFPA